MNNKPVDRQSNETRLTGELDAMYGCYLGGTPDEDELKDWQEFKAKLLAWHETEKHKAIETELEKIQKVCENEDNEFAFKLANAIEDRVYKLNKSKGGKI